jgi:predicted DNA-binding protein
MASTRTQIYLTRDQRRRLDELGQADGRTLAALVREAIDRYLEASPDAEETLTETFGSLPDLEVPPRSEWDRPRG